MASWLLWLRSLSPARVAFAASVATLIVAGALVFPRVPGVPLGVNPPAPPVRQPELTPPPAVPAAAPVDLWVEYGPWSGESRTVYLVVAPGEDLPAPVIALHRPEAGQFSTHHGGMMRAGKQYRIGAELARAGTAPARLWLKVDAPQAGVSRSFFCAVPLDPAPEAPAVSATFVETPLETVLTQMAARVGRPVVSEATGMTAPVSAVITERPAAEAWSDVLSPLGLRAVHRGGTFQIRPRAD